MKSKILTAIIMGFFIPRILFSQLLYRVEADFSIKEKRSSGYENLTMGRVYFDKNQRQIVFDIKFPEKEVMIMNDTSVIFTVAGKYSRHNLSENLIGFSVLNLFLNGELDYFGLNSSPFKLTKTEKDSGLVITTWLLDKTVKNSSVTRLMMSQKNNQLQGIISYGPDNSIVSRQFFSDYLIVDGMDFPGKVIQFSNLPDGTEITKITAYKNVLLNNANNNSFYNYRYTPK